MPRRRTRPSVPWASTAVAALLNFSRPGNQVIGQYYNFLRLGRAGHTQVMGCLSSTARWLAEELRKGKHFEVISDGSAIPVVCLWLAGNFGYTEFDVSHALRSYGWQVPAYTMPADATDVAVLRVVVREGFSADLARSLRDDMISALASLDDLKPGGHFNNERPPTKTTGATNRKPRPMAG